MKTIGNPLIMTVFMMITFLIKWVTLIKVQFSILVIIHCERYFHSFGDHTTSKGYLCLLFKFYILCISLNVHMVIWVN